jgi:hypothetical protein
MENCTIVQHIDEEWVLELEYFCTLEIDDVEEGDPYLTSIGVDGEFSERCVAILDPSTNLIPVLCVE